MLIAIVALAFAIEGALGFGATVVTVTLGAFFLPIDQLLPAFVPLNVVLSLTIIARTWRDIDRRLLFLRVMPLMILGMPVGMLAMRVADAGVLVRVYGVLIVVLAVVQLANKLPPPPRLAGHVLLFCAGVMQGAFRYRRPVDGVRRRQRAQRQEGVSRDAADALAVLERRAHRRVRR